MEHELKISPKYFDAVFNGIKRFEVRRKDRPFCVGDTLYLREFLGESASPYAGAPYSGREVRKTILYILDDPEYCPDGYVILSIR